MLERMARQVLPPQITKRTWIRADGTEGVRYEVRVDVGKPDGDRQQTRRRFATLREAKDYLAPILGDQRRGLHVAPDTLTVKTAIDRWLQSQRIRPTTKAAYASALRPVVDELGDRTVQSITKCDVEDLVQGLQRGTTDRGVWASTSINPMLARLRAVFADLQSQGIVARNVPALVKAVKRADNKPAPTMKTLTPEHIQKLIEHHRHKHDEALIHLALLGLRRGELAALRWSDIDLSAATITVQRARTTDGRTVHEGTTKTESGRRVLPIPEPLLPVLRRCRIAAAADADDGYVLTQERSTGRPFHPRTVNRRWTDALEAAGVPHVRLHDARHTTATQLHAAGVQLADIAAWLGHANAEVTARIYTHSTGPGLAQAAASLGNLVSVPAAAHAG